MRCLEITFRRKKWIMAVIGLFTNLELIKQYQNAIKEFLNTMDYCYPCFVQLYPCFVLWVFVLFHIPQSAMTGNYWVDIRSMCCVLLGLLAFYRLIWTWHLKRTWGQPLHQKTAADQFDRRLKNDSGWLMRSKRCAINSRVETHVRLSSVCSLFWVTSPSS
jgi:hypothetical protein